MGAIVQGEGLEFSSGFKGRRKFVLKNRLRITVLEVSSHHSHAVEGFQEVHLMTSIQQTAELFPRLAQC